MNHGRMLHINIQECQIVLYRRKCHDPPKEIAEIKERDINLMKKLNKVEQPRFVPWRGRIGGKIPAFCSSIGSFVFLVDSQSLAMNARVPKWIRGECVDSWLVAINWEILARSPPRRNDRPGRVITHSLSDSTCEYRVISTINDGLKTTGMSCPPYPWRQTQLFFDDVSIIAQRSRCKHCWISNFEYYERMRIPGLWQIFFALALAYLKDSKNHPQFFKWIGECSGV